MLPRKSRALVSLAVGSAPAGDVLVHAVGVGDEPGGAAARTDFLVDTRPRRKRWTEAVVRVWIALGNRRPDQHFPARVPACFWTVVMVSAPEAR